MEKGSPIPVVITIYGDKSFTFEMRTPPVSYFIKKAAKIESGSKNSRPRQGGQHHQGAGAKRSPRRRWPTSIATRWKPRCAWSRVRHGRWASRWGHGKGQTFHQGERGPRSPQAYALDEAVKLVKERAKAKFDETVEIAMNLGVDPRHADQMVRGVVNLPNGTGRSQRVAVFARGAKAEEAKAAGADVVGAEELVEVQGGRIDFDRVIATPDLMPLVGRLGKVLGPRGMMPNPKVGTVTMDVTTAVKGAKGGSVVFRVEKAGIIQAGVGKASFTAEQLAANIRAFTDAVQKAKPPGSKGHYINRVAISSTMGPGVKIVPRKVCSPEVAADPLVSPSPLWGGAGVGVGA